MMNALFRVTGTVAVAALLLTGCAKGDTSGSNVSASPNTSAAPGVAASSAADTANDVTRTASAAGAASTTTMSRAHSAAVTTGDAAHGSQIFAANCASCHGNAGAGGGIGPVLKGEKNRKDLRAAIAWIKNPAPPMPKLYPGTLSEKDVADVASYVESL